MPSFRDRMPNFFNGRNGVDSLGRAALYVSLILILVTTFTRSGIFYIIALVLMGYSWFRVMSRNIYRRHRENEWFLNHTFGIRNAFAKAGFAISERVKKSRAMHQQKKIYSFYKCPQCRQRIRVPRNRGRIEITCPKCHEKFVKNTGKKA